MKLKSLLAIALALFLLAITAAAVFADGLKNPFSWDNTQAQEAGKKLYQQNCLGCHGAKGNGQAQFDFSAADFPAKLENQADYFFTVLSDGRMAKGMPAYKSSLSEEQRWQTLTYLWSLGKKAPAPTPPPATRSTTEAAANLLLSVPLQAQAGEPLILKATLRDEQNSPIADVKVSFLVRMSFFADGLMEIGEATTDKNGVAVLEYIPRGNSQVEVMARYQASETVGTVTVTGGDGHFYHPEVGLRLPTAGKEIFLGPESAHKLNNMSRAPESALRLPGGTLSWLLLPFIALGVVWFTYFRVMYQTLHISQGSMTERSNIRLIPMLGITLILIVGVILTLKVVIGPFSHFHLGP